MSGSRSSSPGDAAAPHPRSDDDPLSMTVHAMPRADAALVDQRTRTGRWKMLLVLAVCASPVIASYLTYYVVRPQTRSNYAELITPTRTMPAGLGLRTLEGRDVAPATLRKQWLLLVVAPSGCDVPCQERLLLQRQLHLMLGKERDRVDKVWLVTDESAPSANLLTGLTQGAEPAQVLRVPREAVEKWLSPASGQQLEDHLYIVDPMGEWMMRAPVKPEAQRLKRDLDRLLRASSSWDTAGR